MERYALRMVARAHRDDAAAALGGVEREQLVQRASLLERGSELEVLELQPDIDARHARQRAAVVERGACDRSGDARGRGADVLERDFSHSGFYRMGA